MSSTDEPPPTAFSPSAFRGRVYGVTGSAHGIGEATVKELATLGASVVVIDIDPSNLKRVEADLKNSGASALFFRGDVADEKFLQKTIRAALKRWGCINGWVNNAMHNPGGRPTCCRCANSIAPGASMSSRRGMRAGSLSRSWRNRAAARLWG